MPWTKADEAQLEELTRRKAAHGHDLRQAVADLVDRIGGIDRYDVIDQLINNRMAFIEVLERFDEEN